MDILKIGNKTFSSRLILGTGKYKSVGIAKESIEASKTEMVTVAVRRLQNTVDISQEKSLLDSLDWTQTWLLPNTAGSKTAEDAIRLAFLGRECAKRINQESNNFVKLEVIPDPKYLLPDPIGTLKAAEFLVKKGFTVLPYTTADPVLAQHLEDVGCATVMPLGSPIGSGQGVKNLYNIDIMIQNLNVPVIVDAGIRVPSHAAQAMELGSAAVLLNTAVATSINPISMAQGMDHAVKAGRLSYLAGSMNPKQYANASSPSKGLFL